MGHASIPLAGEWRYRIGLDLKGEKRPFPSTEQWPHPAAMYNAMVAPLISHAIRGVVWYQGAADIYQAFRYRELLAAFIHDWRARWKDSHLPFVLAQVACIGPHPEEPQDTALPVVRESQTVVGRTVSRVAVTPMYDLGGTTEPHYMRKREAAARLFEAARGIAYSDEGAHYHGPRYREGSLQVDKGIVEIEFVTSGALVQRGRSLMGFELAGGDRKYYAADADLLSSDTVRLRSKKVRHPVAVRFAWSNHPWATLYDEAGLPAEPFRTERWPLKATP
jgi:sialate O-acetylesterase